MTEILDVPNEFLNSLDAIDFEKGQHGCGVDVASYILFLVKGEIVQPTDIRETLGYEPKTTIHPIDLYLWLLQQGLTAHWIETFDSNRFVDEGLKYLEEFEISSGRELDSNFYKFWTPEKLKERQDARRVDEKILLPYASQYIEEARTPVAEDMTSFVASGNAVWAYESGYQSTNSHSVVYSPAEASGYVRYFSNIHGGVNSRGKGGAYPFEIPSSNINNIDFTSGLAGFMIQQV